MVVLPVLSLSSFVIKVESVVIVLGVATVVVEGVSVAVSKGATAVSLSRTNLDGADWG
jgi:hypothetical protein